MTKQEQRRMLRNYRSMPPSRFHAFNQRVRNGLSDKQKFSDSMWAANPELLSSYLSASDKHDAVYHEAVYGSKLSIAEREVLQAQIVTYLDEIASVLEAAAIHTPDVLLASGFDLTKDRRKSTRVKPALTTSEDLKIPNAVQPPSGS